MPTSFYVQILLEKGFSIARDESASYTPFGRQYGRREEEEKTRAKFIVELTEQYRYLEQDIRVDVETQKVEVLGSVDLVLYQNNLPFLAAGFERASIAEVSLNRAREDLLKKAQEIGAPYAVLFVGQEKKVFSLRNIARQIVDFPAKK